MTDNPYNHPYAVSLENEDSYSFTPKFEKPDIAGVIVRDFHDPYKSRSELTPIQLAVDIPAKRLGHPESSAPHTFNFVVKQQRIMVYPTQYYDTKGVAHSWYNVLSEQERLAVFNYILAEYRHHAHGNDGFRIAAIGITEDNELFIASNTRPSNQLYKKCAETSVISAAIEAAKKAKEEGYASKLKSGKPKVLFKDFLVMAGKDASPIQIACPCGPCTDELYDHMALKGEDRNNLRERGSIYVLPCPPEIAPEGQSLYPLETPKINDRAKNLGERNAGECWKVTPENLYRDRYVPLKRAAKHTQIKALNHALDAQNTPSQSARIELAAFLEKNPVANNLPDTVIDAKTAVTNPAPARNADKGIDNNTALGILITAHTQPEKCPPPILRKAKIALQQSTNAFNERNSIAELDISAKTTPDGRVEPDFEDLNRFMADRINDALIPRMHALRINPKDPHILTPSNLGDFIPSVRCVVLQLKDNTFTYGVEVKSVNDPSMPSAEFYALGRAVEKIPQAKVSRMWAMEMNPRQIRNGLMPTPLKDNLERLTKRSDDPYQLEISLLPYNDGSKRGSIVAKDNIKTYALQEIYPNMYAGGHIIMPFTPALPPLENGSGHEHGADHSHVAMLQSGQAPGPAATR